MKADHLYIIGAITMIFGILVTVLDGGLYLLGLYLLGVGAGFCVSSLWLKVKR